MTFRTIEVYRLILSLRWLLSLVGIGEVLEALLQSGAVEVRLRRSLAIFLTTEMRSGAA